MEIALIDQPEPVEQEAEIFRPVQPLLLALERCLLLWILVLLADFRGHRLPSTSTANA